MTECPHCCGSTTPDDFVTIEAVTICLTCLDDWKRDPANG